MVGGKGGKGGDRWWWGEGIMGKDDSENVKKCISFQRKRSFVTSLSSLASACLFELRGKSSLN